MRQISGSVSRGVLVVTQKEKSIKCLGMVVVGAAFPTTNYTVIFAVCGKG